MLVSDIVEEFGAETSEIYLINERLTDLPDLALFSSLTDLSLRYP
jgi:hypothetical protein